MPELEGRSTEPEGDTAPQVVGPLIDPLQLKRVMPSGLTTQQQESVKIVDGAAVPRADDGLMHRSK